MAVNFSSAEAMIDWFQATSCLTFIHKASQDTGLTKAAQHHYLACHQRVCADMLINTAPCGRSKTQPHPRRLQRGRGGGNPRGRGGCGNRGGGIGRTPGSSTRSKGVNLFLVCENRRHIAELPGPAPNLAAPRTETLAKVAARNCSNTAKKDDRWSMRLSIT
jgi:hypothetical protein